MELQSRIFLSALVGIMRLSILESIGLDTKLFG